MITVESRRTSGHYYRIRFDPGREADAVGVMVAWAQSGEFDFNWSDAANMSYAMGLIRGKMSRNEQKPSEHKPGE